MDFVFTNLGPTIGCIEGIPFIIRFKTLHSIFHLPFLNECIEGIPFIIRFKTFI